MRAAAVLPETRLMPSDTTDPAAADPAAVDPAAATDGRRRGSSRRTVALVVGLALAVPALGIGALAWRRPEAISALTAAVGEDLAELALRIRTHTDIGGLRALGVDPAVLRSCADAAAARPQLHGTPPPADRAEILALYESAL